MKRKIVMKISIVTRHMKAGGAERVIAELVQYMVKKDIECNIITIDDKEIFYELPPQVQVHPIGKQSNNHFLDKILRYKKVRKYLLSFKPDIVLSLPEEIGIYVIPTLIGTRIPIVVSERNNPWVMPWKRETRLMRKIFYPFADGFIFQTQLAASFFSENIRRKSVVLPNPLDQGRIPEAFRGERKKEIVGAGRLEPQKNFSLLIKAFAKFYNTHQDYKLVIYGDGTLRSQLESLAHSLLPEKAFSFPGRTKQLLEKIKDASMFVLSSDFEGMPNVLIEAMAVGLPVIATNCPSGGPAELIKHGKNGLLVPVNDVDAMATAMGKIADDESFARVLGKNAEKIKCKLDSEIVSEKWLDFLRKVANKS